MKTIKYIAIGICLLLPAIGIISCTEADYKTFDTTDTNIYFAKDSVVYSFGTTPYSVTTHTLNVPVRILGVPTSEKRTFKIEIIADKTNAKAGVHYRIPSEPVILPDSITGSIPIEILRENLGNDQYWQIGFRLIANADFTPASEVGAQAIASFNNIVEPPTWTDWMGKPAWPQNRLGVWNPIVWVTFMEYFRKMETTNPSAYQKMVEQYGPNLEHVTYSWPYDYDYTIKKYILIPMYDYFLLHPELGVDMPNPNEG